MTIGEKLRELRKAKRKTLRQVYEETGIDYSNLSQIERGEHGCNSDTLKRLCDYYGTTTDYLLGYVELPKSIEVVSYNEDGTITKFQHELLDMTKGFTEDDFKKVNSYIEFIKSKKESENKWKIER